MKKHILGIAVFMLIVGATFSFLPNGWLRLIPISEMRADYETLKDNSQLNLNEISFDILSVKYDSETNQVTQNIRFRWNGKGNPPESVYVNSSFYTSEKSSVSDNRSSRVNLIFGSGMTADVLVMQNFEANSAGNYYTDIWLTKEITGKCKSKDKSVTKSSPILFVH
jgi:hypothetical protein